MVLAYYKKLLLLLLLCKIYFLNIYIVYGIFHFKYIIVLLELQVVDIFIYVYGTYGS